MKKPATPYTPYLQKLQKPLFTVFVVSVGSTPHPFAVLRSYKRGQAWTG